jgi:hypothetical protein
MNWGAGGQGEPLPVGSHHAQPPGGAAQLEVQPHSATHIPALCLSVQIRHCALSLVGEVRVWAG